MSTHLFLVLALLLITGVEVAKSANILAVCGIGSRSHHIWNTVLLRELGKRGHQITYFSPDADLSNQIPNVHQIPVENFYEKLYEIVDLENEVEDGLFQTLDAFNDYNDLNTKILLESQGFDKLLSIVKSKKFDLLIFDFTMADALLNVADYMKDTPIIGVTAFGAHPLLNYLSGNPESLAVLPNVYIQHSGEMSLWKRLQNMFTYAISIWDWFYAHLPRQTQLARTKFPNGEDLSSIYRRFSLFLVNTDTSLDPVVPKVPAVIGVGGLPITKEPRTLPKEVQTFLDGATHGAILFSLGTNLKSDKLDPNFLKIITEAFRELAPVRVLWKFESDFPNAPSNLMTQKWLPQSDILAHPNIKLFISHSGLLSTQEATYRGVPILGIPFYADQFMNVKRCKSLGFGEQYDIRELKKETFKKTITNMLNNAKYKENAEKRSKIFQDQPETPLGRAVFWTEYVIRHKGAPHLRAESLRLSWYQNMLLDVIAISLAAVLIPLYVIVKVVTQLFRTSSRSTKKLKNQ